MLKNTLRHIALFVAAAASLSAARAADLPSTAPAPAPAPVFSSSDWIFTFSGQINEGPSYPGAKRYSFFGIPGIGLRAVGEAERFSTPDDGFNFSLYDNSWLHVGPVVRVVGDRAVFHNHELAGLPYIEPSVETGGFVEIDPVAWGRVRMELRQAITGHDGLVGSLGGDVWKRWGNVTLSVGPRLSFGSDKYANTYFGVTQAQAAVNQAAGGFLTAYTAEGGLTAAGLTGAARYDVNADWRITGYGTYQRISGSISGSPIVQHAGSRDQYVAGFELAYRFPGMHWTLF
jgi:outer membrane scaffolding protein for murein synthesis (MipA/OmpV family)